MNNGVQTIDFNHLNSIANGDENFKKELISIFLEQIPVFIRNMNKYFESRSYEKLAREAHTAKSSVLIFGMKDAGKLLKDIQHWAENNNPAEIGPALKVVNAELNHAKTELQKLTE